MQGTELSRIKDSMKKILMVGDNMKTNFDEFGFQKDRVYFSHRELRNLWRTHKIKVASRNPLVLRKDYRRKLPTFKYVSFSPGNRPSQMDLETTNLKKFIGDVFRMLYKFLLKYSFSPFTRNYQITMFLEVDDDEYTGNEREITRTFDLGRMATFFEHNRYDINLEFLTRQIAWNILNQLMFETPVFSVKTGILYGEGDGNATFIERSYVLKLKAFTMKSIPLKFGALWGPVLQTFFVKLLADDYKEDGGNFKKFLKYLEKEKLGYYYRATKTNCFFSALVIADMGDMNDVIDFFKSGTPTERRKQIKAFHSRIARLKKTAMQLLDVDTERVKLKDFFVTEENIETLIPKLQRQNGGKWPNSAVFLHNINNNVIVDPWFVRRFYTVGHNVCKRVIHILLLNGTHALPLIRTEKWNVGQFIPANLLKQLPIQQIPILTRKPLKRGEKPAVWKEVWKDYWKVKINIPEAERMQSAVFYWDSETFNGKKELEHLYIEKLLQDRAKTSKKQIRKKLEASKERREDGRFGSTLLYSVQVMKISDQKPINESEVSVFLDTKRPSSQASNCFGKMLNYLVENKLLETRNVFLAHNAAKFDNFFVFTWIVYAYRLLEHKTNWKWRVQLKSVIFKQGIPSISLKITTTGKERKTYLLTFRDTLPFMRGSLKGLAKASGLEIAKTSFTYEQIRTFEDVETHEQEIIEYGANDVRVLATLYETQRDAELKYGVDIASFTSVATMVRKIFFTHFYKSQQIFSSTLKDEMKHRKDYKGGKVEAYYINHWKDSRTKEEQENKVRKGIACHIDFTSAYPFIGANYVMPAGEYKESPTDLYFGRGFWQLAKYKQLQKLANMPLFFVEIGFMHERETPCKPYFGIKYNNSLIFPYNDTKTPIYLYVWKEELEYIIKGGMFGMTLCFGKKIKTWFHVSHDMQNFMKYFFKKKKQTDIKLQNITLDDSSRAFYQSIRTGAKNKINNASGFWAIDFMKSSMVSLLSDVKGDNLKNQKLLLKAKVFGAGNDKYVLSYKGHLDIRERNIFWSIRFTALGRRMLDELNRSLPEHQMKLLYNDTDCALVDRSWKEVYEKLVKKNPDYVKGALEMGGLTNELKGDMEIEELIIGGAKFYAYKDSNNIWHIKFKGVNINHQYQFKEVIEVIPPETGVLEKLLHFHGHFSPSYFEQNEIKPFKFESQDMKDFIAGKIDGFRFTVRTFQFGLTNAQEEYGKKSVEVTKTFRGKYSKGNLEGRTGKIEPLRISQLDM